MGSGILRMFIVLIGFIVWGLINVVENDNFLKLDFIYINEL